MKNTLKNTYEEPALKLIAFRVQDIIATSMDPFFGEDDKLGDE